MFMLAVIVFPLTIAPLPAQEEGLQWIDNYKEALRIAKETGKPIFLEYRCEP
jgi:hypothetical protein